MAGVALVWDQNNGVDVRNSLALQGYRVLGVATEEDAASLIRRVRPSLIVHSRCRSASVASIVRSTISDGEIYAPQLHVASDVA